jgi:hypothetical protein
MFKQNISQGVKASEFHVSLDLQTFGVRTVKHAYANVSRLPLDQVPVLRASNDTHDIDLVRVSSRLLKLN